MQLACKQYLPGNKASLVKLHSLVWQMDKRCTWFSLGSRRATAFQMAPVPPFSGKRNTALGPQPASSLPWMTLVIARVASTVATRSPSHSHCIAVVGYAHTCDSAALWATAAMALTYLARSDLYMCGGMCMTPG